MLVFRIYRLKTSSPLSVQQRTSVIQVNNKDWCNAVIRNKEEESHLCTKGKQSSATITWIGLAEERSRKNNRSVSSGDQLELAAGQRINGCERASQLPTWPGYNHHHPFPLICKNPYSPSFSIPLTLFINTLLDIHTRRELLNCKIISFKQHVLNLFLICICVLCVSLRSFSSCRI